MKTNQNEAGARTQHTPGPWTLRIDSEKHYAILDEAGFPRAEVFSAHRSNDRRKAEAPANARLIAAAPELLATLEQINAILNQPWKDCDGPKTLQIAKADCEIARRLITAAIAKAEGSQS